jgi:hypothetical protein
MAEMIEAPVESKRQAKLVRWVQIILGMSVVLALWALTLFLLRSALALQVPQGNPASGDLGTVLLGTSGIMLGVFTVLVGGLAIFGWQALKESTRKDVEASTNKRIGLLENELRGRALAAIGVAYSLTSSISSERKEDEREEAARADLLVYVVEICERAYKLLKDLEGNGKYMALNNYVFLSCVLSSMRRTTGKTRSFLLAKAGELKRVGHEKSYWPALLTYCRAILEFSDSAEEVTHAQALAIELSQEGELTNSQKTEATAYVASLTKKREKLTARTVGET